MTNPKSSEVARKNGRPIGSSPNRGVEKVSKLKISKAFSDGIKAGLMRAKEITKSQSGTTANIIRQEIQSEIERTS